MFTREEILRSFQFLGIPPKGEHRYDWHFPDYWRVFPISRDPPEGGTFSAHDSQVSNESCFQFLGIPPKGELP